MAVALVCANGRRTYVTLVERYMRKYLTSYLQQVVCVRGKTRLKK